MQLRRGNEASGAVLGVLQLALPPVVVVFTDDLDDVTHPEANACFFTGDEVILGWVVLKLCSHKYLRTKFGILSRTDVNGCGKREKGYKEQEAGGAEEDKEV